MSQNHNGNNWYAVRTDDIVTDALTTAKPILKDYPGGPYDFIYVVTVENCNVRGSYAQPWGAEQGRDDLNGFVKIGFDAYDTWHYKVACHETGHMFGLADYYTNSYSGYGGGQCDPVTGKPDYYSLMGHWYLMGFTNGPASDILALEKWRLGWIKKNQVDIIKASGTTTHTLTPLETPNGTKMILIQDPNSDAAYDIEVKKGNQALIGVRFNQITPTTIRVTFNKGQFASAADTGDITQVLTITPANIIGFDSSKPIDSQLLTVKYKEKTTTYAIQIKLVGVNALYKFTNKGSRKIMELSSDKPGGPVDQWWDWSDTDGDDSECWKIDQVDGNYCKIINKNSGKALEIKDGTNDDGTIIVQNTYTGKDSQLWYWGRLENLE